MHKELDLATQPSPELPEDDMPEDATTEVDRNIIHDDDPNASYPNIVTVEDN